nr:MAG TPA: hypothetical protein [Caudoviricetes sp.]
MSALRETGFGHFRHFQHFCLFFLPKNVSL